MKSVIDYKGGNIVGMYFDSTDVANSAYVFMIQSLLSNYKDVVHILPVKTITASDLHNILKEIIIGLTKLSFEIVAVIADNNAINGKAMSFFAEPAEVRIVYSHPSTAKPLFYLVDSVHLLKCVRNNWLNQKNSEMAMYFPPIEEGVGGFKTASFSTLRQMYKLEADSIVKYGYGLSYKCLYPTSMQKQNVKLVLNIFSDFIVQGIREVGGKQPLMYSQDTSDFLQIILTWWKIMNTKSVHKGARLNSVYETPFTALDSDEKFCFLDKFLNWLDRWKAMGCDTGALTKETHSALYLTTYGIREIASYCTQELGFKYILPGKFQTDSLESRFGLYRQLSGSQYNISVRQLYEGENKLRVHSLLKLKSQALGDIPVTNLDMSEVDEGGSDEDLDLYLHEVVVEYPDIVKCDNYLPVITYIAGYCVFSVLKRLQCTSCKSYLLLDKEIELDVKYDYIKCMDRGKLFMPVEEPVSAVLYNYVIVCKLLTKFEKELMAMPSQRQFITKLTARSLENIELFGDDESCMNGHTAAKVLLMILSSSTNVFLNNYCKKRNEICQYRSEQKNSERKLSTLKGV